MSGTLDDDLLPRHGEPIDPVAMARKDLKTSLPKRFWKEVTIGPHEAGPFAILLDGRPARTPARRVLAFDNEALADLLRQEWADLGEVIDPASMPLTRLINSALDGVSTQIEAVQQDAARYAASDLLCYRAEHPDRLVAHQQAQWDPLLHWVRDRFGAELMTGAGVMFVSQPEAAVARLQAVVAGVKEPLALAALHALTTLTGSLVLALALAERRASLAEIWALAHLDEDFQMEIWGQDEEALARRSQRLREAQAAAALLGLTY
jgi:chaperone required for assembly of F1-ATPase